MLNAYIYEQEPSAAPSRGSSASCSAPRRRNTLLLTPPVAAAAAPEEERHPPLSTFLPHHPHYDLVRGGLSTRSINSRYQPTLWPLSGPLACSPHPSAAPFSLLTSHRSDALTKEIHKLKSALSSKTSAPRTNDASCPSTMASLPSICPGYQLLSTLLLPQERMSFSSRSHLGAAPPYANHSPLLYDSSLLGTPATTRRLLPRMNLSDQCHQGLTGRFFDTTTLSLPHLIGGSARDLRGISATLPSILQYATNGSTMLSSSATSMNATTLLGPRSLTKSLNYNSNKTKRTSQLFTAAGEQRGSFPMILHQALLELERVGDTSSAAFLPDGKSFVIRTQCLFEKRVIPVFFPKMKGFASFQRQLNLYDFMRVGGAGLARGSYHHALFHRDAPGKAAEMKRTKIKGGYKRRRRSSSTASAPTPTYHKQQELL